MENENLEEQTVTMETAEEPAGGETGEAETALPVQAEAAGQGRRQEVEEFLDVFPDVKAEDIPGEVWQRAAGGEGLVRAYALYENALLRSKLEALKQNGENRARSLGSLGSGQSGRGSKSVEEYWDEAGL